MKKLIVLAGIALASQFALAADKAPTAQQQLMGTCNAEAKTKELKGDDRKSFMSSCLSDGRKRQQERMKSCNVDATGKKGDERKAFMSECLKK
ncbi:PsiF family protein [Comamonas sp. J-3]|uniref:PsiF family protein n=1 Tax=Comamonas trifloxystrobinivorans TaxID=3350256 RepID=UPI003728C55B